MKTINRKPLFLAIAGISALGVIGTAQAVSVTPTGLGNVLVFPYYTVKATSVAGSLSHYNTLLSIVNSTASTKAVKVRFREGKASKEVLDFNVFLSPYDVWTASLEPSLSGGVLMSTSDRTCTIPKIPAAGVEFRNNDYATDQVNDGSLERLREGYMEVFEMATYSDDSTIGFNAKHVGTPSTPRDCTKVTNDAAFDEQNPPSGGLTGTASLVNPGSGLNAATDPVVLINFRQGAFYNDTGTASPQMSDADPHSSTELNNGNQIWADWNNGQDAVSAALMKTSIINEFVLDVATASATDWVVTMPTKNFYVLSGATPSRLFESGLSSKGSCDEISLNTWDREEVPVTPSGDDFSPSTPNKVQLCWEANVVSFNGKNVFGSSNRLDVATGFENGWAKMNFHPNGGLPLVANSVWLATLNLQSPPTVSSSGNTSFDGLPVIGFAVQTFRPTLTQSYAGTFYHRYISGAPGGLFAQ